MDAQSDAVVPMYEGKIVSLERDKAVLTEQLAKRAEQQGSFGEN